MGDVEVGDGVVGVTGHSVLDGDVEVSVRGSGVHLWVGPVLRTLHLEERHKDTLFL